MTEWATNLNLIEVNYICEGSYETANEIVLVNGKSLARAMKDIEACYGDIIISVKITPLEEGPLSLTSEVSSAIKSKYGLE